MIDTSSMEPCCLNEVSDPMLFLFILFLVEEASGPFSLVNGFDVMIETTHRFVFDTTEGTYVRGFLFFGMTGLHVLKEMTQRREFFAIHSALICVR